MTKQEALEIIESAIKEVEWEYPIDYAVAFDIAKDCIQKCIDEEESPCYNCSKDNCGNCLYSGRIE